MRVFLIRRWRWFDRLTNRYLTDVKYSVRLRCKLTDGLTLGFSRWEKLHSFALQTHRRSVLFFWGYKGDFSFYSQKRKIPLKTSLFFEQQKNFDPKFSFGTILENPFPILGKVKINNEKKGV